MKTKTRISKHFDILADSMACPHCNAFKIDAEFLAIIEQIRTEMGIPFHLDRRGGGAFRCRTYQLSEHPEYPNSQHVHGRAMDILWGSWSGVQKRKLIGLACQHGLSFGWYKGWVHLDLRPGKPVAF